MHFVILSILMFQQIILSKTSKISTTHLHYFKYIYILRIYIRHYCRIILWITWITVSIIDVETYLCADVQVSSTKSSEGIDVARWKISSRGKIFVARIRLGTDASALISCLPNTNRDKKVWSGRLFALTSIESTTWT